MKAAESQDKTSGVTVHRLTYTQQQSGYQSRKDYYSDSEIVGDTALHPVIKHLKPAKHIVTLSADQCNTVLNYSPVRLRTQFRYSVFNINFSNFEMIRIDSIVRTAKSMNSSNRSLPCLVIQNYLASIRPHITSLVTVLDLFLQNWK